MHLLDMILSTKFSKEDYLLELKKYTFQDVFIPTHKNIEPLHNKEKAKDSIHSLFSIAFFSLNSSFMDALNEHFQQKITYGIHVWKSNHYREETLHEIIFAFFNNKDYLKDINIEFKNTVLKFIDSFQYYIHNSIFLKYKNEGYRFDRKLKRTEMIFRLGVHTQSLPILCFMYYRSLWNSNVTVEYLAKKCTLPEIETFLYAFDNHKNIIKKEIFRSISMEDGEEYTAQNLKNSIFSYTFLFDMISGFTKKNENDFVNKINFILNLNPNIIKELQQYSIKLKGQKDIEHFIETDEKKRYVMAYALVKNQYHMVNLLLDYGYELNSEEKLLLLSYPVKNNLNEKYKYLLESEIDDLSVLVKEFEKNLFKESSKNIKSLNLFLDELSQEKKEYLFSYYDQFQETSMILYRTDLSKYKLDYNDKNLSVIDLCLFKYRYDYIDVLLKHNFPFSREQIYKIGSYVSLFDNQNSLISNNKKLVKSFINFLNNLSDEYIKTIFLRNSVNDISCGDRIIDYFCENLLIKIKITKTDIDLILKTNFCNFALLDKIIKEHKDYFFNKQTMIAFIKTSLQDSDYFNEFSYLRDYKLYPLPEVIQNIFIYLLKSDPEYIDEMTKLIGNSSYSKQIFLEYEKNSIFNKIQSEENEIDKVRIRRRI